MDYVKAVKTAERLKRTLPKGWKVKVSTIGPSSTVTAYYKEGALSLHEGMNGWFVMFNLDEKYMGTGTCEPGWYSQQSFSDPLKAIEATRKMMEKKLVSLTAHVIKYLS